MSETTKLSPLLEGAYELHLHCDPSKFPRVQNIKQIAADARSAKMGGFVTKSHEWPTGPLAEAVNYYEPELQVFGGVVMNPIAGGLNPEILRTQLECSATKLVWMPTVSSEAHKCSDFAKGPTKLFGGDAGGGQKSAEDEKGMTILDENDELLPVMHEILDVIAEKEVCLCTGHLSPEEVDKVVDGALEHGVKKILIQHVDVGIVPIPFEQQKGLAAKGAILEKCLLACTDFGENNVSYEQIATSIKELGAESCVLVTDFGQAHNLPPVQALGNFADEMLANGVSEADIRTMLVDNPRKMLGL